MSFPSNVVFVGDGETLNAPLCGFYGLSVVNRSRCSGPGPGGLFLGKALFRTHH